MALKTFGALTFATLNFASAVLNGAPTDGTITFKPTTFGAEYFRCQTLHGVRNRSHIATFVAPPTSTPRFKPAIQPPKARAKKGASSPRGIPTVLAKSVASPAVSESIISVAQSVGLSPPIIPVVTAPEQPAIVAQEAAVAANIQQEQATIAQYNQDAAAAILAVMAALGDDRITLVILES